MSLAAFTSVQGADPAKPSIRIPGDDRLLSAFASELATLLRRQEIYRRDRVVVVPYAETKDLIVMTDALFVSWIEDYITPFDIDAKTDLEVLKSIDITTAKKTLASFHFWKRLRPIDRCYPVPAWAQRPDGAIDFLQPGYDEATRAYVFPF